MGATDAAAATGYERRDLLGRHVTDVLRDEETDEATRDAIATATFHEHLRVGLRRLLAASLERSG